MNLHLLINISSDTENLFGVQFFNSFFQECSHCNVTLFHICRLDSPDASNSLLDMWENPEDRIEGKLTVDAKKALDKAKRALKKQDVVINNIKTKTVEERYGKVKDILSESSKGLYDAIILGRRATYALQWMFDKPSDEIPQALINDTSLSSPLWICSEPEIGRKNILLCVDGSASSLRAADHVGYILSKAKRHNVTVFHVTTTRTSNIQEILKEATDVLLSHNIAPERITSKRGWGLSIPGAILTEKNYGQYAAVAVGLHDDGPSKGVFDRLGIQGGITATLVKKIEKAALWCCP